ncbi:MAG TPA: Mrp/NBP35 family ATP-binding protein [Bryobacteraceae bacterium]|jgi:ATP-binding protein involved in chromosome partitioning|nr:Mrp/NBP35 family ATP-binding protein [Bryobacteraceae bacterium]
MGPTQPGEAPKLPIPGVENVIAVGSGKGGVGKTTIAVNLALALQKLGHRTALLDADVYGPNVPLMLGVDQTPEALGDRIQPIERHGLKVMSMGFIAPGDKPLIWRGPMLHNVIQQFLRQVDWGGVEFLVVDLPPGTGDVALSLIQTSPITGAIVVTTPSDVSLEDARKAVNMFRQVRVELLGIVENMSYLVCPHCQTRVDVFSHGGGRRTAERMGVNFLGEVPLDPEVRVGGDTGDSVALRPADDPHAAAFYAVARNVIARVEALGGSPKGPRIEVTD